MNYDELFLDIDLPKSLSNSELHECLKKYSMGDKLAREKIIIHNIRYVIFDVINKFKDASLDKKELICVGIMGLMKSIDNFDVNKGNSFSTYMSTCVDNEIKMFMKKCAKYDKVTSLDTIVFDNGTMREITLEETILDETVDIMYDYERQAINEAIRNVVEELPEREKEIIMLRFGFRDNMIYRQEDIAKKLNLTQPYVSRLINKTVDTVGTILKEKGIIDSYVPTK